MAANSACPSPFLARGRGRHEGPLAEDRPLWGAIPGLFPRPARLGGTRSWAAGGWGKGAPGRGPRGVFAVAVNEAGASRRPSPPPGLGPQIPGPSGPFPANFGVEAGENRPKAWVWPPVVRSSRGGVVPFFWLAFGVKQEKFSARKSRAQKIPLTPKGGEMGRGAPPGAPAPFGLGDSGEF